MKWVKIVFVLFILMLIWNPKLETEEEKINRMIENNQLPYEVVKVTMYTVDPKQTDSTPLLTASGFIVDSLNPQRHRIIAVSRDLKRKYKFGSKVMIKGAGEWDGIYTIKDVMNKRWRKKIDILVNPNMNYDSFQGVKMYNISGNSTVR